MGNLYFVQGLHDVYLEVPMLFEAHRTINKWDVCLEFSQDNKSMSRSLALKW